MARSSRTSKNTFKQVDQFIAHLDEMFLSSEAIGDHISKIMMFKHVMHVLG